MKECKGTTFLGVWLGLFALQVGILFTTLSCRVFPTTDEGNIVRSHDRNSVSAYAAEPRPSPGTTMPDSVRTFEMNGIKVTCFVSTDCEVKLVREMEVALKNRDDKPDNVHPEFSSLHFLGGSATQQKESFFSPKIRIYSLEKFKDAIAVSAPLKSRFNSDIASLKQIIDTKDVATPRQLPFVPYIDGHPSFISHFSFMTFGSGTGIGYLTQFDIEPAIINNEGLTYIFQGLTSDNKYYVLATFPVQLRMLPKDYSADSFGDYKLPFIFNDPEKSESNGKEYTAYVESVKKLLENSPDEFEPRLFDIRRTISSLVITE